MLAFFKLFTQVYFMGLFFFISGYFTPGSIMGKEALVFLKKRFISFGIPILLYIFVLGPYTMITLSRLPAQWNWALSVEPTSARVSAFGATAWVTRSK